MHGDDYRNMKAKGGSDHESYSKMESEEMAPKAKDEAGWKLESVSLKATENGGFIATCSKTKKLTGKDRGMGNDYQHKEYAFGNMEDALAFVKTELEGYAPGDSSRGAPTVTARG